MLVKSHDPRRTSGQQMVCIDRDSPVSLDINQVRIQALSSEEAHMRISCKDPERYRAAIVRNGDFGGVVIGADEGAIALFSFLKSADVVDKCGHFPFNDFEKALLLCKDIRVAGGADSNPCLDICEDSTQGVCTEVMGR
jgi:hypothetical protein